MRRLLIRLQLFVFITGRSTIAFSCERVVGGSGVASCSAPVAALEQVKRRVTAITQAEEESDMALTFS
ncbi:MAG: hypothetical protein U0361_04590 [Nitrospiraceae bacterium]